MIIILLEAIGEYWLLILLLIFIHSINIIHKKIKNKTAKKTALNAAKEWKESCEIQIAKQMAKLENI